MPLVYPDTNILIRAFEGEPAAAKPVLDLFLALRSIPGSVITSELTLAEVLAPVKISGSLSVSAKTALYGAALIESPFIELVPVSRSVLLQTAILRQTYPQKLPDAIHVVTAVQSGCRYLMSSDKDTKLLQPSIERVLPNAQGLASNLKALRD